MAEEQPEKEKKSRAGTKICPKCKKHWSASDVFCMDDGTRLVSAAYIVAESIIQIALSLAAPLAAVYFLWSLLAAQGILIYAGIILALGTLGMYLTIRKHGIVFAGLATGVFFAIYFIAIAAISIITTGNVQPVYNIIAPFLPASWREGLLAGLQSGITGLQYAKCYISLNFANCNTQPGNTVPKICKPISDSKLVDIQFGELGTGYKLLNPVRAGIIFVAQITISNYETNFANDITVYGELKNETGDTIKMEAMSCITPKEHCQVGVGKPALVVTLKSSKPVDFLTNSIVYLTVSVSYPFSASGSNDFYIVRSNADLQGLDTAQTKALTPGTGPLDAIAHFSSSYYVVGSSEFNPDSAKILVFSDIINGKMKCNGENGYGKVASIEISHFSAVQGISGSCATPDGDPFNENEVYQVGGLKVTDTQEYTCNYTIPDVQLTTPYTTVKFITAIDYNYTDVKKTDGMAVCPNDRSKPCAQ